MFTFYSIIAKVDLCLSLLLELRQEIKQSNVSSICLCQCDNSLFLNDYISKKQRIVTLTKADSRNVCLFYLLP